MFLRRELGELRSAAADVVPRRLRPNEDVHLDLDARIAIDAAQRHPMHLAVADAAECGAAALAETKAPALPRLKASQQIFASGPRK
jgi:hypothetical protein